MLNERNMKTSKLVILLSVIGAYSYADCTFIVENKTSHPVTVQGFYLENGEGMQESAWVLAKPHSTIKQTRVSDLACNDTYQHSGELVTKIELKNDSGEWKGNKGLLFADDKSYACIENKAPSGDGIIAKAQADDKANITLSNGIKISDNTFKVKICDVDTDSDDCE